MENPRVNRADSNDSSLRIFLNNDEITIYDKWISHSQEPGHQEGLLRSVPKLNYQSLLPATCLCAALERYEGHWPKMEVINAYTSLQMPFRNGGSSSDLNKTNQLGRRLEKIVQKHLGCPNSFFNTSNAPAIIDPTNEQSLSHAELSNFVNNFRLPIQPGKQTSRRPVIAIALPNGYTLGLACLAVSSIYVAAPINIAGGPVQFRSDAELIQPQAILVLSQDVEKLGLDREWVVLNKITILILEPNLNSTFAVRRSMNFSEELYENCHVTETKDIAFLLLTSGTSGTKKVVPVTTMSLIIGTLCVTSSWGLSSKDICINMMPLNHVGGLVRNLFAPVMSGGSTILCPSFDPNLFWDLVSGGQGTWYYASPSMHSSILSAKEFRDDLCTKNKIRLVCNAAGALLPSLATRLRNVFECTVLPSYGMTECMPISTPPLTYSLDRPGTSGISCGPEIGVMNYDNIPLSSGETGRILVRGGPTFPGYIQDGKINTSSLSEEGWFDTGDLGYLDDDGYLYLTGRSKEVINRGGEIISPFEIEEAIMTASSTPKSLLYERVKAVIAFSAPHEILQEVVGVVIVSNQSMPRPDLRMLNSCLNDILHVSKLPAIVIYMESLPMINNKVVRIRLGERMGLQSLKDSTRLSEKHFEAICPPLDSSLDTKIETKMCSIDSKLVHDTVNEILNLDFDLYLRTQPQNGLLEALIFPKVGHLATPELKMMLTEHVQRKLHGYLVPQIIFLDSPLPGKDLASVDKIELEKIINRNIAKNSNISNMSSTQFKIISAISEVLDIPLHEIQIESDFFDLGGDSLSAGILLSTLRRDYQIRIPIHKLFAASSIRNLSELADELKPTTDVKLEPDYSIEKSAVNNQKNYSYKNPIVLFIQLLPITLFYPMKLSFWFTMFIYSLSFLTRRWTDSNLVARFLTLIAAICMSTFSTKITAPVFGIMLKWIIIGRYKAGSYPMWGAYHTRWWIVNKILLVCGKGIFKYSDYLRPLYYRALGAHIGRNVQIEVGTELGEYDLLTIDDNVHLDRCICRPFACESNTTMFLGEIQICRNSSIGLKSHVAAGSFIPENTFIGPNSSSHEKDDVSEDHRGKTNGILPRPHFLLHIFAIFPVQILVQFISALPWMVALIGVVDSKKTGDAHHGILTIIEWWALPRRIALHYVAALSHMIISPIVRFFCIIFIKYLLDRICGKAIGRPIKDFTSLEIYRTGLIDALKPNESFLEVTKLFGSHYELTSAAARALGARIGKRVYWPGTGPIIQDFDLLEIGDDVVFGSRSYLVTRDGVGSAEIKIDAGAMIADRVVLSPGTRVGRRAILGSGAFTRRGQECSPDTIWIGKKNGSAVCLSQTWSLVTRQKYSQRSCTSKDISEFCDLKQAINHVSEVGSRLQSSMSSRSMSEKDEISASRISNSNTPKCEITTSTEQDLNKETISPFGRAFYDHQAPYYVFTLPFIFFYTLLITTITRIFWDTNIFSNLILFYLIKYTDLLQRRTTRSLLIFGMNTGFLSVILSISSVLSMILVIATKWIIIGRRKPGNYDWDKSSYCQRWQLQLTIESFRTRCFGGNGVLGMLTGTYYIVLYYRLLGAQIGSNTALFASGPPAAYITEPDLIQVGSRVAIDDASLVAHINSRGKFDLRTIKVDDGTVLRSGSRLLSGASTGKNSKLLEHTLIMAGDRADDDVVYQGWPAEVYNDPKEN
ncbi:hypothetical protein GcC1_050006 [Golovinomyces cichoracearum]|uniref:Carrier domain-containing protein n=1 Tax=Golovinomyces cichoracearum TaxID=62708 RepID=A0A420IX21_9PEZI|nr:hypothetical protein GcC1_050006 [Golovinomyces cichoracearum]